MATLPIIGYLCRRVLKTTLLQDVRMAIIENHSVNTFHQHELSTQRPFSDGNTNIYLGRPVELFNVSRAARSTRSTVGHLRFSTWKKLPAQFILMTLTYVLSIGKLNLIAKVLQTQTKRIKGWNAERCFPGDQQMIISTVKVWMIISTCLTSYSDYYSEWKLGGPLWQLWEIISIDC